MFPLVIGMLIVYPETETKLIASIPTVSFQSWLPEEAVVPDRVNSCQLSGYWNEMPLPLKVLPDALGVEVPPGTPVGLEVAVDPPPPLPLQPTSASAEASARTSGMRMRVRTGVP